MLHTISSSKSWFNFAQKVGNINVFLNSLALWLSSLIFTLALKKTNQSACCIQSAISMLYLTNPDWITKLVLKSFITKQIS